MSRGRERSTGRRSRGAQGGRVATSEQSASVSLSRGGTSGFLNNGAAWGVGGSHELGELRVRKLSVTVGVDTSDHGKHLRLDQVVSELAEEVLQVGNCDAALVVPVDGAERCEGGVIWATLHIAGQLVHSFDEVNLVLQQPNEAHLKVVGESIETTYAVVGALLNLRPEAVVITGQNNLDEVGKG